MPESRLEITNRGGEIEIPAEICCNCASSDRVDRVQSELKLTRYFGMGGSEYTFKWALPYCPECKLTASRTPVDKLHIALMIGLSTVALFLVSISLQAAMDKNLLGGNDFWFALVVATLLVGSFYTSRKPRGGQTSYYQPIRIRKLRQKFTSGEVTGIVLGFTNGSYMSQFQELNSGSRKS
jgi:hypothetical protein